MNVRRVRYILPKTENFRETRPFLCWENMYGWLDGYGVLFDPVLQHTVGIVPEWENGWDGTVANGDFFIASSPQATMTLEGAAFPGIYVRPRTGVNIMAADLHSDKECLLTPLGRYYYPKGRGRHGDLLYDRYAHGLDLWVLGEYAAAARCGQGRIALAFDFFSMLWVWNMDWPERRLSEAADLLQALLAETGCFSAGVPRTLDAVQEETRLDFQAYGLNRLMIQWFLEIHGQDRAAVAAADHGYRAALAAWHTGHAACIRDGLTSAFSALAELRRTHSRLKVRFCEFPHMGILLDTKGFFELEWPEYSRRILESYFVQVEKRGYKVSLEAGAGCWKNMVNRFPRLGQTLRKLWAAGKIELTNGTYSLPYALVSPLALQYWQFHCGHETFRRVFGRVPDTYQAQENSLGPQTPELLRHFGYARALHISQNRGMSPAEKTNSIIWQSPAGCGIPSMSVREPALARKGMNYYLDLPLVHRDYGEATQSLDYINFQDLGYVPFRVHMIRAHHYAPVWGEYAIPGERLAHEDAADAPTRTYTADAYHFSANIFYGDFTNANVLSQYERIFTRTQRFRQAQFMAFAAGRLGETQAVLEALLPSLLVQEAHDVVAVQDQKRGEFYASCTMDPPPYSRETLMVEARGMGEEFDLRLDDVQRGMVGDGGARMLYNASGVSLPYARVRHGKHHRGAGLIAYHGETLAVGPFAPFGTSPATALDDIWRPAALPLACGCWKIARDSSGEICLACDGTEVSCAPVDKRRGRFSLLKAEVHRCGPLVALNLTWAQEEEAQLVQVDLLLHQEASFAEFGVKYAPREDFDQADRWSDYLALEVKCTGAIETVWRFNPNVRSVTAEDRIASPNYLAVRAGNIPPVAFMNEGSFLYETDRAAGTVRWLFHVADEHCHHRRMALAFGADEALELSRAWSQGVVPLRPCIRAMPDSIDWSKISAETFTRDAALLISNTREQTACFSLPEGLSFQNVCGNVHGQWDGHALRCTLGAFEIALVVGLTEEATTAPTEITGK